MSVCLGLLGYRQLREGSTDGARVQEGLQSRTLSQQQSKLQNCVRRGGWEGALASASTHVNTETRANLPQ